MHLSLFGFNGNGIAGGIKYEDIVAKAIKTKLTNNKQPVPVTLADTPVPVVLAEEQVEKKLVEARGGGMSMAPNTTEQEDIVTAGQRKINMIWEVTQAAIAIMVTGSMLYAALTRIDSDVLKNAFFLIIGFYFSRTNHQSIGGVGRKASEGPLSRR